MGGQVSAGSGRIGGHKVGASVGTGLQSRGMSPQGQQQSFMEDHISRYRVRSPGHQHTPQSQGASVPLHSPLRQASLQSPMLLHTRPVTPNDAPATEPPTPASPSDIVLSGVSRGEPAPPLPALASPPSSAPRPSISALHPWPRPVPPTGNAQGDATIIHSLRAFLGGSTIAIAHALLVMVRELESKVKEVEEALVHLRAAAVYCPEVGSIIETQEKLLSTLNWQLSAQREIHEHFLSHASHIARLDAAAF